MLDLDAANRTVRRLLRRRRSARPIDVVEARKAIALPAEVFGDAVSDGVRSTVGDLRKVELPRANVSVLAEHVERLIASAGWTADERVRACPDEIESELGSKQFYWTCRR